MTTIKNSLVKSITQSQKNSQLPPKEITHSKTDGIGEYVKVEATSHAFELPPLPTDLNKNYWKNFHKSCKIISGKTNLSIEKAYFDDGTMSYAYKVFDEGRK